jgi:hypothetical protein
VVAPFALSLPSLGVSSLDLGRLRQRRRPFFLCMPSRPQHSAPAKIPIHNPAVVPAPATSASKGNPHGQDQLSVTFDGKVVGIRRSDRSYTYAVVVQDDADAIYHWAHNYVPHETDRKNFAYDSIANPRLSINYSTYILADNVFGSQLGAGSSYWVAGIYCGNKEAICSGIYIHRD